jgi:hypothetical protein
MGERPKFVFKKVDDSRRVGEGSLQEMFKLAV